MNEQLWQILVLTLAIAALFGGLAWWSHRRHAGRLAALRRLAERSGWTFSSDDSHFVWQIRTLHGLRELTAVAVQLRRDHGIHSGASAFTRCEMAIEPSVGLLIRPRAMSYFPTKFRTLPMMAGIGYETMVAWPEIEVPTVLSWDLEVRALDGTIRTLMNSYAVVQAIKAITRSETALDPYGFSDGLVVTMYDGLLRVTILGRALWSPDDVDSLIHLCKTLSPSEFGD